MSEHPAVPLAAEPAVAVILDRIAGVRQPGCPLLVGLCGPQGSGKTTIAAAVAARLEGQGLVVAVLSLDDLYLSQADRARAAQEIHPLLRVRGVPGTHAVALGEATLDRLAHGGTIALPRFDKAADSPLPQHLWPCVTGPADVILFEGWCVGARPQEDDALTAPVNQLERDEDSGAIWRTHVNTRLGGAYARLFARIGLLVLLAPPGFDIVVAWRQQQERQLRARLEAANAGLQHTMDDAAVARFVLHYERLTRHILDEMPGRADLVLRLDRDRRLIGTNRRS